MYKLSRTRIFLILAICVIGIFFAIPNMMKDPSSLPKWWQPVNLGLDLQGGSNLLLEVKLDDVLKDRMSTVEDSAQPAFAREQNPLSESERQFRIGQGKNRKPEFPQSGARPV